MYLLHLHLGFRVASGFILFSRLTHLRMPYAVSVRQVSGLPPASFRSRLAADTLALGYVLGATPCIRDFHPLERAHAERTIKKPRSSRGFALGATQKHICPDKNDRRYPIFLFQRSCPARIEQGKNRHHGGGYAALPCRRRTLNHRITTDRKIGA